MRYRISRREVTEMAKAARDRKSVLACCFDHEIMLISAPLEGVVRVTFCQSEAAPDLKRGLPENKFSIDFLTFDTIYRHILSGKSVSLSSTGAVQTLSKSGRPSLTVTFVDLYDE